MIPINTNKDETAKLSSPTSSPATTTSSGNIPTTAPTSTPSPKPATGSGTGTTKRRTTGLGGGAGGGAGSSAVGGGGGGGRHHGNTLSVESSPISDPLSAKETFAPASGRPSGPGLGTYTGTGNARFSSLKVSTAGLGNGGGGPGGGNQVGGGGGGAMSAGATIATNGSGAGGFPFYHPPSSVTSPSPSSTSPAKQSSPNSKMREASPPRTTGAVKGPTGSLMKRGLTSTLGAKATSHPNLAAMAASFASGSGSSPAPSLPAQIPISKSPPGLGRSSSSGEVITSRTTTFLPSAATTASAPPPQTSPPLHAFLASSYHPSTPSSISTTAPSISFSWSSSLPSPSPPGQASTSLIPSSPPSVLTVQPPSPELRRQVQGPSSSSSPSTNNTFPSPSVAEENRDPEVTPKPPIINIKAPVPIPPPQLPRSGGGISTPILKSAPEFLSPSNTPQLTKPTTNITNSNNASPTGDQSTTSRRPTLLERRSASYSQQLPNTSDPSSSSPFSTPSSTHTNIPSTPGPPSESPSFHPTPPTPHSSGLHVPLPTAFNLSLNLPQPRLSTSPSASPAATPLEEIRTPFFSDSNIGVVAGAGGSGSGGGTEPFGVDEVVKRIKKQEKGKGKAKEKGKSKSRFMGFISGDEGGGNDEDEGDTEKHDGFFVREMTPRPTSPLPATSTTMTGFFPDYQATDGGGDTGGGGNTRAKQEMKSKASSLSSSKVSLPLSSNSSRGGSGGNSSISVNAGGDSKKELNNNSNEKVTPPPRKDGFRKVFGEDGKLLDEEDRKEVEGMERKKNDNDDDNYEARRDSDRGLDVEDDETVPRREREGEKKGGGQKPPNEKKKARIVLDRFSLWETKSRFYIFGHSSSSSPPLYRLLKIDRAPAVVPTVPTSVPSNGQAASALTSTSTSTAANFPSRTPSPTSTLVDKDVSRKSASSMTPNARGNAVRDERSSRASSEEDDDDEDGSDVEVMFNEKRNWSRIPTDPEKRQPEASGKSKSRASTTPKVPGSSQDSVPPLSIIEDPGVYTATQVRDMIEMIGASNPGRPGIVRKIEEFYGIVGFIRFTLGWHLVLIRKRSPVALIGGHTVYHCEKTQLWNMSQGAGVTTAAEARQIATFSQVDLTKNFYFSYTYDLTHTLQVNLTRPLSAFASPPSPDVGCMSASMQQQTNIGPATSWGFNKKFVWNHYLLRSAFGDTRKKGLGANDWVLPLLHGFVDQAKLIVFGRIIYITLIARRSRYYAGARYLRRGANEKGHVANDVETEQIVSETLTTPLFWRGPSPPWAQESHSKHASKVNPRFTSFVQVRGSIPLTWKQEPSNMSVKPPIEIPEYDPFYSSAALHFNDLFLRYGSPVVVLNLIKHKERGVSREAKLLPHFAGCVEYLNQSLPTRHKIEYIAWDLAHANKLRNQDVIHVLEDLAQEMISNIGFFHTGPEPPNRMYDRGYHSPAYRSKPSLQWGITRTNCIDCIDRTNAAQFVIAKVALAHQLYALGFLHTPHLPYDSDATHMLTEMYHDLGDTVALQYGGSNLVNRLDDYDIKIKAWNSHSRNMIENVKRYYANSFVDAEKQLAIDLFLGVSQKAPKPHGRRGYPLMVPRSFRLPKAPHRPHYRNWYNPTYLEPRFTPEEAEERMIAIAENDDWDFWNGYYDPKRFTVLEQDFSGVQMNGTHIYWRDKERPLDKDLSPFKTRRRGFYGEKSNQAFFGVRRWVGGVMARPAAPRPLPVKAKVKAKAKAKSVSGSSAQEGYDDEEVPYYDFEDPFRGGIEEDNPVLEIIANLLRPEIEDEELMEYRSYVQQFDHMSLGLELSEQDLRIYRASTAIASQGSNPEMPEFDATSVPPASVKLYKDMASKARFPDMILYEPGYENQDANLVEHGDAFVGGKWNWDARDP